MTNELTGTALIYGATGYMGRLCARQAVIAGLQPVLAGRDARGLTALGDELDLPTRVFALDDATAVRAGLAGVSVVLNAAGPFRRTGPALVQACLGTGAHYLDLAGEVPEFQTVETYDAKARQSGVMLMPGAGFGVVPTDCLAAHLHRRLPDATHLQIAFQTVGGLSRGTATTLLQCLPITGVHRLDGQLRPQRAAAQRLKVNFGDGPVTVATNPWRADVVTAARSTRIANIDTYTAIPAPVRVLMNLAPRLPVLFDSRPWHASMNALIRRLPAGPTQDQLAAGSSHVWARASTPGGPTVAATLAGPEAYAFTAHTARLLIQKILAGHSSPGFQTPATAYGPDLILELDGVRRVDR